MNNTLKDSYQSLKIVTVLLLLLNGLPLFSQSNNYADKVSTHIEFAKDTLLLGEPSFFYYVLTNNSKKSIFIEEGGDYRSGRKVSFNVFIISSENDTLTRQGNLGAWGGFIKFHKIKPKESRKFKLFLPMWGDIEEANNYTISVSKNFKISPFDPFPTKGYSKVEVVPKESTKKLYVVENYEKLGVFIENLINEIREEDHLSAVRWEAKGRDKNKRSIAYKVRPLQRVVLKLTDDRIVPFLIESYNFYDPKIFSYSAFDQLLKFSDNNDVLQILKDATLVPDDTGCELPDDDLSTIWSCEKRRREALIGIMQSKNKTAMEFLLSKKYSDYPDERYLILDKAKYFLTKEERSRIYNAFKNDLHEIIAKKAKEEVAELVLE